jgi:hypothetical protein
VTLAESRFFSEQHPEVAEADIWNAIRKVRIDTRKSRVYFGIDERDLLSDAGHYATYGSEYQIAIAVRVVGDGYTDYRQTLKRRGRPAVVVAHLPLKMIDDRTVTGLAHYMFQAALWSLQLDHKESPYTGFSIELSKDIPAEYIVEVIHAPHARDPLTRF